MENTDENVQVDRGLKGQQPRSQGLSSSLPLEREEQRPWERG